MMRRTMIGKLLATSDRAVLMRMQGGWLAEFPLAGAEITPLDNRQTLEAVPGLFRVTTDAETAERSRLAE